jgi:hypothetical protein
LCTLGAIGKASGRTRLLAHRIATPPDRLDVIFTA